MGLSGSFIGNIIVSNSEISINADLERFRLGFIEFKENILSLQPSSISVTVSVSLTAGTMERAKIRGCLEFSAQTQRLKGSLSFVGAGETQYINLGHWVPFLDWIEIYGLRGEADGDIVAGTCKFTISGGIKLTFHEYEDDSIAEGCLRYNPDPRYQGTYGVTVAYFFLKKMGLLDILRGFFRLSDTVWKALVFIKRFFPSTTEYGMFGKYDDEALSENEIPSFKNPTNPIVEFLKQNQCLGVEGLRGAGFCCKLEWLGMKAELFGMVTTIGAIPTLKDVKSSNNMGKIKDMIEKNFKTDACLKAKIEPIHLKVRFGDKEVDIIRIVSMVNPGDAIKSEFIFSDRDGMYFKLDHCLIEIPVLQLSLQVMVEFMSTGKNDKSKKKQPRLMIEFEAEILQAFRVQGYLRVCMAPLPFSTETINSNLPKPLSKALELIGNFPRSIKASLSVQTKGILGAVKDAIVNAFNLITDIAKEALEKADQKLREAENIPVLGIFVKCARVIINAVHFLVDMCQKGIQLIGHLIKMLTDQLDKVLIIEEISIGGELGGDEGCEMHVSFIIVLFGCRIQGGLQFKLKTLILDLAKSIAMLFLGRNRDIKNHVAETQTHMKDHLEDSDTDEESTLPGGRRTSPTMTGGEEEFQQLLKDAPKLEKADPEEEQKLQDLIVLVAKVQDKLKDRDQIDTPSLDSDDFEDVRPQLIDLITGISQVPQLNYVTCPVCGTDKIVFSEYSEHLKRACTSVRLPCKKCGILFAKKDHQKHELACSVKDDKSLTQCTSQGCAEKCTTSELQKHLNEDCKGQYICQECDKSIQRNTLTKHLGSKACNPKSATTRVCPKCHSPYNIGQEGAHNRVCLKDSCSQCFKLIAVDNMRKHLDVECECRESPCTHCRKPIAFKMLAKHEEEECPRVPMTCEHCKRKININIPTNNSTPPQRKQYHLRSECVVCPILCALGCNTKLRKTEIDEHLKVCEMNKRKCGYEGCPQPMLISDIMKFMTEDFCGECNANDSLGFKLPLHMRSECPGYKTSCFFQCGSEPFHRRALEEHSKNCTKKRFSCPEKGCSADELELADLTQHAEGCFDIVCPFGCGKSGIVLHNRTNKLDREELSKHWHQCPKAKWYCPAPGCNAVMSNSVRLIHLFDTCDKFMISCFKCKKSVALKSLGDHLNRLCKENTVKCHFFRECGNAEIPLWKLKAHMEAECQFNRVNCTWSGFCSEKILKKNEINHINEVHVQELPSIPPQEFNDVEGIDYGNNISLLLPQTAACLVSKDKNAKVLASIDFLQELAAQKCMTSETMSCLLGCGMSFPPYLEGYHRTFDCENFCQPCSDCNTEKKKKDHVSHKLQECEKCVFTCSKCGQTDIKRKLATDHFLYFCRNKLQRCIFCNDLFPFEEISSHQTTCTAANSLTPCQYCEMRIPTKEIINHLVDQCEKCVGECPLCKEIDITMADLGRHYIEDCTKYIIPCYFCSKEVFPVSSESRNSLSAGENSEIPRSYLDHLLSTCERFSTLCGYCDVNFNWQNVMNHYFGKDACKGKKVKCWLKCSEDLILLSEYEEHLVGHLKSELACKKYKIKCRKPNCDKKIQRYGMQHHLLHECDFNLFQCENCEETYKEKERLVHSTKCDMKLVVCSLCGDSIPEKYMEDHKSSNCNGTQSCPYKDNGCSVSSAGRQMKFHKRNCGYRKVKAHYRLNSSTEHSTVLKPIKHDLRMEHGEQGMKHPQGTRETENPFVQVTAQIFTFGIVKPSHMVYNCCGRQNGSPGCTPYCTNCGEDLRRDNTCRERCTLCKKEGKSSNPQWTATKAEQCYLQCPICYQDVEQSRSCNKSECSRCAGVCTPLMPGCQEILFNSMDDVIKDRHYFSEIEEPPIGAEENKEN